MSTRVAKIGGELLLHKVHDNEELFCANEKKPCILCKTMTFVRCETCKQEYGRIFDKVEEVVTCATCHKNMILMVDYIKRLTVRTGWEFKTSKYKD